MNEGRKNLTPTPCLCELRGEIKPMNQKQDNDESLYAAYRRGDMAAFELLYARYRQPLYRFLLGRGHSPANTEDVFHDCWMRLIDKKTEFAGENFRAWFYTIARNLSTDAFRKINIRIADSYEEASDPNYHVSTQQQQEGIDCIELIKSSVAALPSDQRDVFLLKEEAGLSLQQIADLMAVGRETIKSRIRYAMNQLRLLMVECL